MANIIGIPTGAFRFTGIGKKELLWDAHILLNSVKYEKDNNLLFHSLTQKPVLPKLEHHLLEDMYDEIELIGFPVTATMFDLARTTFRGDVPAADLAVFEGRTVNMIGDFVCNKYVQTKSGKVMKFGTFFDVNGDFFDTVHFPPSLAKYPLYGNGVYQVIGKVVLDFGCPAVEVEKIGRLPLKADPRSE